jgi:hypothetical protein
MVRTVSQIEIEYRDSQLSAGRAGEVHGGDRLPWTGANFAPLASLDWQVHVYGEAGTGLRQACTDLRLPLHVLPAAPAAGLPADALCLVRPDGYVALADTPPDAQRLRAYLAERALAP